MTKQLVIFDLDGTLLNTIGDLTVAVNHTLGECGFPLRTYDEVRSMVGDGVLKLLERALPEAERTAENLARAREIFLPFYGTHNAEKTHPYEGIPELLEELRKKGVRMAVASNKYHAATCKLIPLYFPTIPFEVVLGQREGVPAKPHPQIVVDILREVGVGRKEVLYVGDTNVDMLTAKAAEVEPLAVEWGFRPREELAAHNPRAILSHPLQLLDYL
jgi:phosphoglycolate phosphatase